LIFRTPDVDSCHGARRQPARDSGQYCPPAAPHIEHDLVAA